MLAHGLRPGELLSLRVEDVEFGAICGLRVTRRPPDLNDLRRRRPSIKRNGRILTIDQHAFAQEIDEYISMSREELASKSDTETGYLLLSDEGDPLSQSTLTQLYQRLREKFPAQLPEHLSAKSLRHTFSSRMEKEMREAGMEEQRRCEALAFLRGDSSLDSQSLYIRQEIEEQVRKIHQKYQRNLLLKDVPW